MKPDELAELSKEQLIAIIRDLLEQVAQLKALLASRQPPAGPSPAKADPDTPPKKGAPSWAKRNRHKRDGDKEPRHKRDPKHNHGRCLETPTRTVDHRLDHCPECGSTLHDGGLASRHQVIELPPPQPVEIIGHHVIKSFCPQCEQWRSPTLDLDGRVLGQRRMGVRVTALIAYLRNSLRLPIRSIQSYLSTIHQMKISIGEIVELLHATRRVTEKVVEGLKEQAQGSAILHADETGWRQDGQNGYIWSFVTQGEQAVRYYEYDASRGQAVLARILDGKFHGHLVSDFYAGYNDYQGPHQRCWVHLLRDLHELKEEHATETEILEWARAVRKVYDDSKEWLETANGPNQEERERKYVESTAKTHALALQYAEAKDSPCRALAKRLLRHEDELVQFVLVDGLSPNNNLAERSIRPLVVIRKISGGTRSDEGTKTRMVLASLFETLQARGLNPYTECLKLLHCQAASP